VSYDFEEKRWVSFHSYTPNLYVQHIDRFESSTFAPTMIEGVLGWTQKLYEHNYSNKSYQVFYDKLEPFVVEYQAKPNVQNSVLNSIEYYLDVIRYHNDYDLFYNRTKTFNKAIVYNHLQTSGLLNLLVSDPNNDEQSLEYPKYTGEGIDILVSNSENLWRFNDFFDVSANQKSNLPLFLNNCANSNKHLNPMALNYGRIDIDKQRIRSRMNRVRLINDIESNYKMIFDFSILNQINSIS
jgi:hypothetical protein